MKRRLLPKPTDAERRYDIFGEFRLMAATEGYVLDDIILYVPIATYFSDDI